MMAANWQKVSVFPTGTPDITLVFRGLMALCQRTDNFDFEFGCFGTELDHKLSCKIDTKTNGVFTPGTEQDILQKNIEFFVQGSDNNVTPVVYQSVQGDSRDFSYVIDIEQIYNEGTLAKKEYNFNNLITVKNGLLYTVAPTASIFEIRDSNNVQIMPPRTVAFCIAINVYLATGETGILNIAGENPIVLAKDGSQRFVRFNNSCQTDFNALSSDPTLRNDFYLNYQHVIDTEKSEINEGFLSIDATQETATSSNFANLEELEDMTEEEIEGKEMHPCSVYGYGHTDSW